MKTTFLSSLFLFVIHIANACCAGGMVNIYPSGEQVSQNPIFLINYAERDYSIFNKLDESLFYIEYEDGKQVDLEMVEKNEGSSTMAQVILKPKRNLKLNESFTLRVKNLEVSKHFIKLIEHRKWKVSLKKDRIEPNLNSIISHSYYSHFESSAPGHGVKFKIDYSDNQKFWFIRPKMNQKKISEILVKITSNEGKTYVLPVQNNSSTIYNGMCGSIFNMKQNKNLEYSLQLMDWSGNLSANKLTFKFKTQK